MDPTNKVLIFTKSVKLIDMLEFHLDNQRKKSLEFDFGLFIRNPHRLWICQIRWVNETGRT